MSTFDLLALIFGAAGAILILSGIPVFVARNRKRKRCSYETKAVITENIAFRSREAGRSRRVYYGVYEYSYRGETYQKRSYVGTSFRAKIGKEKLAFVNPDRPEECIIEGWVSALAIGLLWGIGALFTVLALVFVLIPA